MERFRAAWQATVDAHDILRTAFLQEGEQPLQVVYRQATLPFALHDWQSQQGLPASLDALAEQERQQGFDLAQAPLLRLTLVRTAATQVHLIYTSHHILMDGWSSSQLLGEVLQRYSGQASGQAPGRYRDYIAWLQRQDVVADQAFWQEQLSALDEPTLLARALSSPSHSQAGHADHWQVLEKARTIELGEFARRQKVTVNTLIQAAWLLLLQRYTGQATVAFGATVAGRPAELKGVEQQIGLFINTLPVVGTLKPEQAVTEWLQQVQAQNLALREHEHSPLFDIQRWAGRAGEALFDTIVVFENYPVSEALEQGAPSELEFGEITSKEQTHYPLTLMVNLGETLNLQFSYDQSSHSAATVALLSEHLMQMLAAIIESHAATCVGELDMLGAGKQSLLRDWNGTQRQWPDEQPVHVLFERQVLAQPGHTALLFGDASLTYAQANQRANQLAHQLIALGVGPEVIVGIAAERSLEMVIGLMAILKAGGAYVPLDPEYPQDRLSYMFEDSGIDLLLTQEHLLPGLPAFAGRTLLLESDFSRFSSENPAVHLEPENLAYVIYTSGSTGKPKGAGNRHTALHNRLAWMQSAYPLSSADTVLQKTPFSFDVSVWEFFWPLMTGARLAIASPGEHREPEKLIATIRRHSVTTLHFVPSMLQVFIHEPGVEQCVSLKQIMCSGEALQVDAQQQVFARLPSAGLYNLYGPTEAAIDVTHWTCRDEGVDTVPIGEPIANLYTHILDASLNPVPQGATGELVLGGLGLARGYHRRPALTAERFIPDPHAEVPGSRLYRTGDLAKYRETGVIEYQGRIDHQVKIRGLRIELGEIEARLLEQESVKEAVVLAVEGVGGLQLVAYIVPVAFDDDASSQAALRDTLKTELKAHLPDYMVPAQMLCLAKLPVTPNGKLDRRALPAPEAVISQAVYIAPVTELEQAVAQIWQEVLKAEQLGLNDHFFELGGHSLLATQVVSRIRRSLGIEAALRTLFEHPQLGGFVAALDPTQARDVPAFTLADRSRPLPVSFAQQRQWVLWQLDPHSAAYNIPAAMTLKGPLNVEALQQSFNALIQRHESLRTTFTQQEGEALQVIHSSLPLAIHAEEGQYDEAGINAFVEAEVARPFDLENGPLLRVRLLKVGAEEHVLTLTLHHIVSDAWSTPILVQELVRLYAGFAQGQPAELPALPIQYADYALWQRTWMANGERDRQLAYWTAQLGGEQPVLELPLDRPRPAAQSFRGASVDLQIPTALSEGIRALAKREGATPFMVLLAAYQTLLHRYSGQADIRVGVPIANRNHLETEGLIGFFVNTQVLKANFDAPASFSALLQQVKHASLDAQRYQDLPFDQLVEALQPERNMSHNPLFQAMFNYLRAEDQQGLVESLSSLSIHSLGRDTHTAQLDLTLEVSEFAEGFNASFTYATDLFEGRTIQRFAAHLLNVLAAVVSQPERLIGEVAMLSADEAEQALRGWNVTQRSWADEQPVHVLFEQRVLAQPEHTALLFGDASLTYAQANRRANQLAHQLIALGVGPEVIVGIAAERSLEMVIGLMAILKAGGAYVPLDPEYPQDRLSYMFEDSGIDLLLTQEHLLPGLPAFAGRTLLLESDFSRFSSENPAVHVGAENLAYVIYTSGSTGKPKGAGNRHTALHNRLAWMQSAYPLDSTDTVLQKTPFSFDVSVWEFFWPLMTGARLAIAAPGEHREPEKLIATIQRHSVTTLHFVPSMLQVFIHEPGVEQCVSLKQIMCSGEALQVDAQQQVFARLPSAGLYNLYGPTEAAIDVTHWTCRDEGVDAVPIGEPIANLYTHILDASLNPVPQGATGELVLGGLGLARGYHRRPALTAERFIPDPHAEVPGSRLYRTGDLAKYRETGVIEYQGRIDHQVKIRGLRIELGEIEARLLDQESVKEAVVLALEGVNGLQLVAYIVPSQYSETAENQAALREILKAELKTHLPDYMVPAQMLCLPSLPVTPNGKLDRRALPAPDASQLQGEYIAPQSELEQRIAQIWQDVLRREQVGITDNFFELGGDSIISIQVVSRARQAGIRFTPKELFEHQTVQGLAQVARIGGETLMLDQGPVTGETPLLPFQQVFFNTEIPEPHHWNQSVLLKTSVQLDANLVEQALEALTQHHDALRLVFTDQTASFAATTQDVLWHRTVTDTAALEALCQQAQASLNLETGPLLRAVLADLPDGSQRLLLVIHHLAVDGVSWRVLLEDLQTAFTQLQQGQAIQLPAKTSSVKAWAHKLQHYAQSEKLQAELGYWKSLLTDVKADLPVDHANGGMQNAHSASANTSLPRELTQKLLQEAPAAYRTQVNDLLLTALARVISRWTGHADTLVQMEGHGREDLFDDIDLTRTVGWFTSLYPVRLTATEALTSSIKQIKEQLRAVPDKGIGFGALRYLGPENAQAELAALPTPRITFNYLGQFDGQFGSGESEALFNPAQEHGGAEQSEKAPLQNWLSINGQVYNGELNLNWAFSREMFDEATIERLAADYAAELQALIEHCCNEQNGGVTPSDFPLARITQLQLDELPIAAREIDDLYPLSPMQQGMLFHTLYQKHSGGYINQLRLNARGLDVERFKAAWQATVEAHDILRTGFVWDGALSQPLQVVHKQATLSFVQHTPMNTEALEHLALMDRQQGFDLAAPPLLRLQVVPGSTEEQHLIFTSHHILMDGWSQSQLLGEVLQRYSGQMPRSAAGRYRDYIAWLQKQDTHAGQAFWEQQLGNFNEPTYLADAIALPRSSSQAGYAEHTNGLSPDQTAALIEFARQQKVTPNTVVQAAWLLLLQRYTGQASVSFGATVAGRPADLKGAEQQIGLFINTLPIIATPVQDARLADWLQQLQAQNLALREHEHTPLFEIQRWAGQGGEALFDNILVFENYPVSEALEQAAPSELEFASIGNQEQANYPLTLGVVLDTALAVHYSFDRSYFDNAAIAQIGRHFMQLLLAMAHADKEAHLGSLSVLEVAEREQALQHWNRNAIGYPSEQPVHALFEAQVRVQPEATALIFEDRELSYAELNTQANRLAHQLIAQGVGPEVLVGIAVERSLEMVVGILAVLKAGGGYVPLDPQYPQDRLHCMIEDSRIALLLTQSGLQAQLPIPSGLPVLLLDAPLAADLPVSNPDVPVVPQNLAYVMFTSGSTGRPKGVGINHLSLTRHAYVSLDFFNLGGSDRVLQFSTFNFDGFVEQLYPALVCGASVVIRGPEIWDSETFYRHLIDDRITTVDLTTAYWYLITKDFAQHGPRDYGLLRQVHAGGEAMPPEGIAVWKQAGLEHVTLLNTYGPTEATVTVTALDCAPYVNGEKTIPAMMPIGDVLGGRSIYLLDQALQPTPQGVAGEILIGGELLARGYFGRAASTAERFVPDPFEGAGQRMYRTGDLARANASGTIEYVGRIDHQVKIRGFRIELGEIEAKLLADSRVGEAIVLARESANGLQLVAYVVPNAPCDEAALRDRLRTDLKASLPDYMVPAHWLVLERLPLSPNGKLDRKALSSLAVATSPSHCQPPQTELEVKVAQLWAEVLGLETVGRHDNFFELGGHSLKALNAVSLIKQRAHASVTLQDFMMYPTLAQLCQKLEGSAATSLLAELNAPGASRTLFCVPPAGGSPYRYRALANALQSTWHVKGLIFPALVEPNAPMPGWQEMIERYTQAILRDQPSGEYHLLGWSIGGPIAMGIAQRLEQSGRMVSFLGLVDPTPEAACQADIDEVFAGSRKLNVHDVLEMFGLFFPAHAHAAYAWFEQYGPAELDERFKERFLEWATQHTPIQRSELAGLLQTTADGTDFAMGKAVYAHLDRISQGVQYPRFEAATHCWWSSLTHSAQVLDRQHARVAQQNGGKQPCTSERLSIEHAEMVASQQWIASLKRALG
ncbi:amino acid adenylation domain-containing protein [Pseudomonas sp. KNUC1026]|nr:non-ribosomal peptide synthetase [Pseudomonas sp. KNUC1026]UFH51603.1 amino acid adenylation domain-containing protein [Pseudomonas sp. KNUC1026]